MTAISFIIPCWKSDLSTFPLLSLLLSQVSGDDEIIICDNGGNTFNTELIQDPCVYILSVTEPGSYVCRNRGAIVSSNEFLCFLDCDIQVCSLFVETLRSHVVANPDCAFVSNVLMFSDNINPNIWELFDNIASLRQIEAVLNSHLCSVSLCLHREAFKSIGCFDTSQYSGGDSHFARKLLRSQIPLKILFDAPVYHKSRHSLADIYSKHARIGSSKFQRSTSFFSKIKTAIPYPSLSLLNRASTSNPLNVKILLILICLLVPWLRLFAILRTISTSTIYR